MALEVVVRSLTIIKKLLIDLIQNMNKSKMNIVLAQVLLNVELISIEANLEIVSQLMELIVKIDSLPINWNLKCRILLEDLMRLVEKDLMLIIFLLITTTIIIAAQIANII